MTKKLLVLFLLAIWFSGISAYAAGIPSIKLTASTDNLSSKTALSVNVGESFEIHWLPKNLQWLSYYVGTWKPTKGYFSRAFFFDQQFSDNNNCEINEATTDEEWSMTCDATVQWTSSVYVVIYANGKSYKSNVVKITIKPLIPSIKLTASTDNLSNKNSISVNVGDSFEIHGLPKNLQWLSYYFGAWQPTNGYFSRAFFFDQTFSDNNNCEVNEATTDEEWSMSCDANVAWSSSFYVVIYANGKSYKSNVVKVKINKSSTTNTTNTTNTTTTTTTTSKLPDLVIDKLYITDLSDYNIVKSYTHINDENDVLMLDVKNIGNWPYYPTVLADDNYIFFECYGYTAWEWGSTDKFEAGGLQKWDGQAVIFPNNLFKTFLKEKWTKTINCYINYGRWMKDKYWNNVESNYTNNLKTLTFEVK